eukprot:7311657-Pyramimonas_sp.AAC.1
MELLNTMRDHETKLTSCIPFVKAIVDKDIEPDKMIQYCLDVVANNVTLHPSILVKMWLHIASHHFGKKQYEQALNMFTLTGCTLPEQAKSQLGEAHEKEFQNSLMNECLLSFVRTNDDNLDDLTDFARLLKPMIDRIKDTDLKTDVDELVCVILIVDARDQTDLDAARVIRDKLAGDAYASRFSRLLKCFPKGGKILFRVDTELAGVNQSAALDQQLQRLQASATWEDNEPILNCDESFTRVAFNGDTLKNLEAVFRGLAGLRADMPARWGETNSSALAELDDKVSNMAKRLSEAAKSKFVAMMPKLYPPTEMTNGALNNPPAYPQPEVLHAWRTDHVNQWMSAVFSEGSQIGLHSFVDKTALAEHDEWMQIKSKAVLKV